MRDMGVEAGDEVIVELAPEDPQRADLAEDISAALAANPAAATFYGTLAQFCRRHISAGSMRLPAGQTCVQRASLRSQTSSRRRGARSL